MLTHVSFKGATLNNSWKGVIYTILELRKHLKEIYKNISIQNQEYKLIVDLSLFWCCAVDDCSWKS